MRTTSFINLFASGGLKNIEIPIIQRDYAQGRQDDVVSRIRATFLAVLHRSLTGGAPVSLDFVYGDVTGGKLTPLDGQQRLTTLFLLHWYVATRAVIQDASDDCLQRFTYETRYSSRDFCRRLVKHRPPLPIERLADWIRDQSWFFATWRHDPTIQSMLVVLDDIHNLFKDSDCDFAWQRLTDVQNPAIVFHVLQIKDMGLTDDLYIKMNSRGKPLTRFEHFKADFEKTVKDVSIDHYELFIHKIDNAWADLLWPLRGDNDIIDDQFMRYFRYVTDILIQRTGVKLPDGPEEKDIGDVAEIVYGKSQLNGESNQRFLFAALDCWIDKDITAFFNGVFVEKNWQSDKVAIYGAVDLFRACCKDYGNINLRNRSFSLQLMLLLFAVVVHLTRGTDSFPQRIRTVRNLIFGSENEIRLEELPRLLEATCDIIVTGSLLNLVGYNTKQVQEESSKIHFISLHSDLQESLLRLEDHTLIRGCVAAFELDVSTFTPRVAAFLQVFAEDNAVPLQEVSGALLACGDYSQQFSQGRFQFGCKDRSVVWRELFTNTASKDFTGTKIVLMRMLDALVKGGTSPIRERLRRIVDGYLAEQERLRQFDWRYYLVRYNDMREGDSGIYVGSDGAMGFSLRMLDKERLSSNYRDPYLFAVFKHSGATLDQEVTDLRHTGYATEERWMRLVKSGVRLTCRREGFSLSEPTDEAYRAGFARVVAKHNIDASLLLRIPQVTSDGVLYDTLDRVRVGATLVQDLVGISKEPFGVERCDSA